VAEKFEKWLTIFEKVAEIIKNSWNFDKWLKILKKWLKLWKMA